MRILVVSKLYPPDPDAGGYELECATVVDHLRQRHEVDVLTSRGPGDAAGVHRVLSLHTGRRDSLLAAPHALAGVRAARRVAAAVDPQLLFVWNGAGLPQAALHDLTTRHPTAYRVCEHWFTRLYGDDAFLRHLTPGETGMRGAWARGLRLANRHPALRADPGRLQRAAVSWNSEWMREHAPAPPFLELVHTDVTLPATARVDGLLGLERRPADEPVVAYLGRVTELKGPLVAAAAVATLPGARLELGGAVDAELEAPLRAHGDAVELLGPLDEAGVRELLARAHAVVVPSVWDEPAGMVALEAAAAGVPVVASRVGGIPEVLRDGREALLFERGDSAGCAAALKATLAGGPEVEARVVAARERARELAVGPYLERIDGFVGAAVAALA